MSKPDREQLIHRAKQLKSRHSRTFEMLAAGFPKWLPQCDCHCTEILIGEYVDTPECVQCNTNYKKFPNGE